MPPAPGRAVAAACAGEAAEPDLVRKRFLYQVRGMIAVMREIVADRASTRGVDAIALGIAVIAIVASLAAVIPGPTFGRSESIAAVFPPWWHQARVFEAAAGAGPVLDVGRASFVVVVGFPDEGVVERLRSAGALILVDAAAVGCAPSTE